MPTKTHMPVEAIAKNDDIPLTLGCVFEDVVTIAQAVVALRQEVAELKAQLATEVRTRRLVVVDAEGRERITGEVSESTENCAELTVRTGVSEDMRPDSICFYASVEAASVGLYLSRGGNGAAHLSSHRNPGKPHHVSLDVGGRGRDYVLEADDIDDQGHTVPR